MSHRTVIEMSYNEVQQLITEQAKQHAEHIIAQRFTGTTVDSHAVCQILRISPRTLYKHVKLGNIPTLTEEGQNYKFSLAEILRLNTKDFKYKKYDMQGV